MNNRWYAASSEDARAPRREPRGVGALPHDVPQAPRVLAVVPYKEEVRWLQERAGLVVGDFGCGEALLGKIRVGRPQGP
jgi:hypothetical protein